MSATKEIKTLLQELRLQLDEESRAKVEPILRNILDASKPKTITQVEYRSDPKDKAQIEELCATIVAKDAMIRTLQTKLATPPPLLDHMSFDDQLQEIDNRARAFAECATTCMRLMHGNATGSRRRKEVLERLVRLWILSVGNYLRNLYDCDRIDIKKLGTIIDENAVAALRQIAHDVEAAAGIKVDLTLSLLSQEPQWRPTNPQRPQ